MPGDVPWIWEVFSCMWRLSSIDKDLTELDKALEKYPALGWGGGWTWMQTCVFEMPSQSVRIVLHLQNISQGKHTNSLWKSLKKLLRRRQRNLFWQMPCDVPWMPEVFSCMWQLSSNYKDLTKLDKMCEKSPALRGGGIDMNADICL